MTTKLKRALNEIAEAEHADVLKSIRQTTKMQRKLAYDFSTRAGTQIEVEIHPDGAIDMPTRMQRAESAAAVVRKREQYLRRALAPSQ